MTILVIGYQPIDAHHRELMAFQVGYIEWNDRVVDHRTDHHKKMKMRIQGQFLVKYFEFESDAEAALFKLTYL